MTFDTLNNPWLAFYEGRIGNDYLEYVRERYRPFIRTIYDRIRPCDDILELGVGTGTITKILLRANKYQDVWFQGIDICPEMIRIAKQRMDNESVGLQTGDVRYLDGSCSADVVHSHGLLEHFGDEDIRKIISNFSEARVQIHYVPGLYDKPSFGDERLMPIDEWWRIVNPTEILTFNGGLDYALIIEESRK